MTDHKLANTAMKRFEAIPLIGKSLFIGKAVEGFF